AELLDAEIPIVDIAALAIGDDEGQRVDDGGDQRIAEPDPVEQGGALAAEQTAIVGWQANGGIAPVDGAAKIVDGVPVAGGGLRKHVASILATANVEADAVAQAVVVVAAVAHRQQVAILRIENEQEPV